MNARDEDDAPAVTIRAFDYLQPMTAGKYSITVEQHIELATDPLQGATQDFIVTGHRFAVPAGEIHAFYPPDHSSGPYEGTVPHVVLNARTFPWERALLPQEQPPPHPPPPPQPWVALLLLTAQDLDLGTPADASTPPNGARSMTVEEALSPKDANVAAPKNLSCSEAELASTCSVLDLPRDTFLTFAASLDDLRYLAHVREVTDTRSIGNPEVGAFSVVTTNRVPTPGTVSFMHLVSCEGHEELLRARSLPDDITVVRLISLAAWSFSTSATPTDGEDGSFKGLAQALTKAGVSDDLALRLPFNEDDIRLPDTDPRHQMARRLSRGYVPLSYGLPGGQRTFGWYRSPLAPAPTDRLSCEPFQEASEALILGFEEGVFDISLASAWTIGRSLALADRDFAVALLRFRKTMHRLFDTLLGGLQSSMITTDDLGSVKQPDLAQQLMLKNLSGGLVHDIRLVSRQGVAAGSGETRGSRQTIDPARLRDDPKVREYLRDAASREVTAVAQWLAGVMRLLHVPFAYLVPHPNLLPPGSVRFFTLDRNWLAAAADGALRIGLRAGASIDMWLADLTHDVAMEQAWATLRPHAINQPRDAEPISGMILRSPLITGWPGLDVTATVQGDALTFLRSDLLGPGVKLWLFDGNPDTIKISAPHQSLHFAVRDTVTLPANGLLPLDTLVADVPQKLGEPVGSAALAMYLLAPIDEAEFTRP